MASLYSYVIVDDNGAAPNPFWGTCTLVICKPQIRRLASVGDWIVGTGSARSPLGDIRGQVVYAMKVTGTMPMQVYDAFAKEHLPGKIPDWHSHDPRRWAGDAIYDFSCSPPNLRKSVHGEEERKRDLGGENALLSEHFYYFGNQPIELPGHLQPLVKKGQGHRSTSNQQHLAPFQNWLEELDAEPNILQGKPAGRLFRRAAIRSLTKSGAKRFC